MGYTVGVSTGFYRVQSDPSLLGLATKIAYGATHGVQFVQIDIETLAELKEPLLKYKIKRSMQDLGVSKVGVHAEIETVHVDTALKGEWDGTHLRLCETIAACKEYGFFYVNCHLSGKTQLMYEDRAYFIQGYFYPVVGPDGQPIYNFCEKSGSKGALEVLNGIIPDIIKREPEYEKHFNKRFHDLHKNVIENEEEEIRRMFSQNPNFQNASDDEKKAVIYSEIKKRMPRLEEEARRRLRNEDDSQVIYDLWKKSVYGKFLLDNSEIGAYEAVATAMIENGDPIWKNICGGNDPKEAYETRHDLYNAACAAKYLEGHVIVKDHPYNKKFLGGLSIKEFCEKNRIYMLFETPAGVEVPGHEGQIRLFRPIHGYHLMKKIDSPYVKLCLDAEHLISQKLDIDSAIDALPDDGGKYVVLFHLGRPVPYGGTAHRPLILGSRSQELIYRWFYKLRKKGMHTSFMLFERGSGQTPKEVFESSVLVMRQVAKYLEKDMHPDQLPPEFYGVSFENEAIWKQQITNLRAHAYDPLQGMLSVPEETHTFLGRHAIQERSKGEEWKKGQFR